MKQYYLRFIVAAVAAVASVQINISNSVFVYADEDVKSAADDDAVSGKACQDLMGDQAELLSAVDLDSAVQFERKTLAEFIRTGPDSLLAKSPWSIMNSAQRALDMIYGAGKREVRDRRAGFGTLTRYAFFSDAIDLTDGLFMVGHLDGIQKVVTHIETTADGQPGKDHIVSLIGPPGTGKSHILTLFRKALLNATIKREEYFAYTFEWMNLSEFPELKSRLPASVTRKDSPEGFADPINDSPFAVLPKVIQDRLLAKHGDAVQQRIGRAPDPKRTLNPQSQLIKNIILAHYKEQLGRTLTAQEEVVYLSKHIRLKRLILGYQTTAPYLANQGKEPNLPRLFGSNNPVVKATVGIDDAFAVHYGVFAKANGGVVFLDEIMKNEPSLIGQFLNLFSSHVVEIAPGVNVPVDMFMLTASNTKERDEIFAKDPQNPLLSRNDDVSWPYVVRPDEVGRVLVMELQSLMARPLGAGQGSQEWTKIEGKEVFKLFPEVEPFQPVLTPHGRFALKVEASGGKSVYISPHALEFMDNVVTLTRLNFSRDKVKHGDQYPIVRSNDAIFSNPIIRLRVLLGQKRVTEAQLEDLSKVSVASGEGEFGIDHRDVERWWRDAMARAQTAAHGYTITPLLLHQVLEEKILEDKIFRKNKVAQREIMNYANMVFNEFVAPAMHEDLILAFVRSEGREVMDQTYDEIVQELGALGMDSAAERYIASPTNESRMIDRVRLQKIAKLYQEKQGRPLVPQEIAAWQMLFSGQMDTAQSQKRNPQLLSAIAAYQADVVFQKEKSVIKRLLDIAGNSATDAKAHEKQRASEVMTILQDELGYNLRSAQVAIEVLTSLETNKNQRPPKE